MLIHRFLSYFNSAGLLPPCRLLYGSWRMPPVHKIAVLTLVLCHIHYVIGTVEKVLKFVKRRKPCGDSHAAVQRLLHSLYILRQLLHHPFDSLLHLLQRFVHHENNELIPTKPGKYAVVFAKTLRNHLSCFPKHHVPESVSVDIIDSLEIVQIQHNQMRFFLRIFLQPSDDFVRGRPLIVQPCQEIRLYFMNHILLAGNGSVNIFDSAKDAFHFPLFAYNAGIPHFMPLIPTARSLFQIGNVSADSHIGRAVQHIQQSLHMVRMNAGGLPEEPVIVFHYFPFSVIRKIMKKNHFILRRLISEK